MFHLRCTERPSLSSVAPASCRRFFVWHRQPAGDPNSPASSWSALPRIPILAPLRSSGHASDTHIVGRLTRATVAALRVLPSDHRPPCYEDSVSDRVATPPMSGSTSAGWVTRLSCTKMGASLIESISAFGRRQASRSILPVRAARPSYTLIAKAAFDVHGRGERRPISPRLCREPPSRHYSSQPTPPADPCAQPPPYSASYCAWGG